jgi:phosphoglycolate phosphatase-like HAD superfamily hydrolase
VKDLIADLDGTVLACGRYYGAANDDVADALATQFDIDKAHVRELIEFLDVWAIKMRPGTGFQKDRFPKSLCAASAAVQFIANPDGIMYPAAVQWAFNRGNEVFDFQKSPYTPFDRALDTLKAYRVAGWRVWICTKGDQEIQDGKIKLHEIDKIVNGWQVVAKKDGETLRNFCHTFEINPLDAVYVGDSVRDDMKPAREIGMKAVRVRTNPIDSWLHDTSEDLHSHHQIESLKDLPTVVPLG